MQVKRIIAIALGIGALAAAGAVGLEKTGNLPDALRAKADRAEAAPAVMAADAGDFSDSEAGGTAIPEASADVALPETDAGTDTASAAIATGPDQTIRATDASGVTEASGETAGFLSRVAAMFTSRGEDRADMRQEAQPRVLRGGGGGRWQSAREND